MRHNRKRNRLNRPADQRKAALRALATNLLREKQIDTTLANARAVLPEIEKLVGLAKRRNLHALRQAAAFLYDKAVLKDLFSNVADRYEDRKSGFARIIKNGNRRGDNAPLAIIQMI